VGEGKRKDGAADIKSEFIACSLLAIQLTMQPVLNAHRWRGSLRPRSCPVSTKEWYTSSYNRKAGRTGTRVSGYTILLIARKPPKIIPSVPFVEPRFHTPYSNPILLGQNYQEKILRSHLEEMGTVVEFGSELRGFQQSEDHVTVQIVRRLHGEELAEESQVP
jgi:hypothetical protein